MSNEFRVGTTQSHQIGTTNTPFTHTFTPVLLHGRPGTPPRTTYPTISVMAPGYDSTIVNIKFTGLEP
jgi:hypothetical protein